jgi:hypothetical protein
MMSDLLSPSTLLSQAMGALMQSGFEVAFSSVRAWRHNRGLARHLVDAKSLLSAVAPELAALREGELAEVPEEQWIAAVYAVRDSLEYVMPIQPPDMYRVLRDGRELEEHVAQQAADVVAGLAPGALAAYRPVLACCCRTLVNRVNARPELAALVQSMSIRDVDRATARIVDLVTELLGRQRVDDLVFEQRYLDRVSDTMHTFELFGVSSGRARVSQTFDRYYVSLALTRRSWRPGDPAEPDGLTGAGTDGAHAITQTQRVLLQGGAGAGKTTFLTRLRLIAARGAQDGESAQWPDSVPFYLPLRRFADAEFPDLEDLVRVSTALAGEKPPGWVSALFRDGRGMLLLDGMDELNPARRADALEWLDRLVADYPNARYVIGSRPSVVQRDWLAEHEFVTFDLLPLSDDGIRDFIKNWHAAAIEREVTPRERAWLAMASRKLAASLAARPELAKLASSPLLCGLICALHRQKDMILPADRRGLFDAALDLLLVRWDEQRGVLVEGAWPRSKEEQLLLLQRFAYGMVVSAEVMLPRAEASARFARAILGLRSQDADPDAIVQQAVERTGLLREPYPDQIQFVHRTFRDYLAAREFVESGLTAQLVEHAHEPGWREIVVMAVAQARPKERGELLTRLLDKADTMRRRDYRLAERLDLVAAVCLDEVQVIDPESVRSRAQEAVRRLIPPASFDDAEALARAGAFVLDLLPGPDGLAEDEAARVVHIAARIGGEGAWTKIAPFAARNQSMVIDELLAGWRHAADVEDYARTVLSNVDFGDLRVPVRRYERARELRHFTKLRAVRCIGDIAPLDPLADIPHLHTLELRANSVVRDLSPLAACRTLRDLELLLCESLRDLSALAQSTVEYLSMHRMPAVDLATLRDVPLLRLRIQHPKLDAGLHALPGAIPLRELVLDHRGRGPRLGGIGRLRTLERLVLRTPPVAEDVPELAELPMLRQIAVRGLDHLADLEPLCGVSWPSLREVEAHLRVEPTEATASAVPARLAAAGIAVRVHLAD